MNLEMNQLQQRNNPREIQGMFDEIAPTYDLLNHLMSFGLDIRWRRSAIKQLEAKQGGLFLDIAAGSGDVSLDLLRLKHRNIVGADFALNMLHLFREKLAHRHSQISLVSCDALALPFRSGSFDATIVAFGIRNFANRLQSLEEMLRVLKPGGISVILELSHPVRPGISELYRAYSRWVMPLIGRLISGSNSAYRYLPSSVAGFPAKDEFISLMATAGFVGTRATPLTFGVATIYVGQKSVAGE